MTPLSNRRLITLFLIALPIFILLRWDFSAWVEQQVQQAASQNQVRLQYDTFNISGLGLTLTNLSVAQAGNKAIKADSLHTSLSLASLFAAKLGVDVEIVWQQNPISCTISQSGDLVAIDNIDAQIKADDLKLLLPNLIAALAGNIELTGNAVVNPITQKAEAININAAWLGAQAGLGTPQFQLGDYQLQLNSDTDPTQPWAWSISGGNSLAIDGKGLLNTQDNDPMRWGLSGQAGLTVDDSNPTLTMMIKTFAGGNKAKMRLSGTLATPRADILH